MPNVLVLRIFYLHARDGTHLIPGRALVPAGALVHHLPDDQVAVDHLVVWVVLDRLFVKGPLVLRLRVTLGRAPQLEQRLADGGLPLARLFDHDRRLSQNSRLHHLVNVAELVGSVAGVRAVGSLVHMRNAESLLVVESGYGLGIVGPKDVWRGDSGCLARQFGIGAVGSKLRRGLRLKLWPVGENANDVTKNLI